MHKNYFKIAYRNLLKNKVFSLVNIFGLAIGMAACFFIFLYVRFESGYDRFNKHAADLYRVSIIYKGTPGDRDTNATNSPAVAPALKEEFPEVIDFARIVPVSLFMNAFTIAYKDNPAGTISFNEERIFLADSSFPKMFTYPFTRGNPENALTETHTIVLSESEAKKYFAGTDPIGKTLYLNEKLPLKVTGVFRDVPDHSHLRFDMLISARTFRNFMDAGWDWPEFYTYVQLAPGADPKILENKLPAFVERHFGELMKEQHFRAELHLQHVTDIHLETNYIREAEAGGSKREIELLSLIGVFILVIAWINYVNLTTAKSMDRAKEVGLRKMAGASRIQLIRQFIVESAVVNLLALSVASLIVVAGNPYFGRFTGKNVMPALLAEGLLHDPLFWVKLAGIFVAGAFLVGAYPAFVLSGFRPVLVLKGKFQRSGRGISLRRILVSFQFVLSILLIAATSIVYKQLSFMRNQSLGYNRDQMLIVKAPPALDTSYFTKVSSFQNEIHNNPSVNDITTSSDIPGQMIVAQSTVGKAIDNATHSSSVNEIDIDENFLKTFQIQLAAGRDFLPQDKRTFSTGNMPGVIVNEEVVRSLGFASDQASLNQDIIFGVEPAMTRARIVGVVKNYHQRSLKEAYEPILYFYPIRTGWKYFSLNVNARNLPQNISSIGDLYKRIFPGQPFDYFFLNEYFDRQYQSDQQFGRVFGSFTILAIFVACLGLLGLSSFAISLRTKEIGIRKVLGATVPSIVLLFSKDFVRLVCVATVIAIPIIYFLGYEWLSQYAFRTRLNWVVFFVPPVLLLLIALATVSIQSVKAAVSNPVKSLRTD